MRNLIMALAGVALWASLSACGGGAPKTAGDFGKKFCECVDKHKGQNEECAKIMNEAKKQFPDGKDDFMAVAKDCFNR